ncbi:hypothetical protein AYO20_09573 [Fonsecaea nubica]|uniref:Uncharacterized protein n=1 Tax=Fonsecaea nubica TaxID=856822 RepID=A0A178CFM9_9EURO|nr:hypothetical protein AYO20_09573 [Fonsecaea nubica]OAL28154.1 hypothetical protein AYO20_09573 [Fonsecaea nubica]
MPLSSVPIPLLLLWVIWLRPSQGQTQSLQFSNVPESINEGAEIFISWTGGDGVTPIAVDLVQDGRIIDDVFNDDSDDDDGIVQQFEWDVDIGDNFGGYYSLRLIQGTQTVDSAPINIIDESGRSATAPLPSATTTQGDSSSTAPPYITTSAGGTTDTGNPVSTYDTSTTTAGTTGTTRSAGGSGAAATTATAQPGNLTDPSLLGSGGGSGGSDLSGGAIAGLVIGVLAALGLVGLAIWFLRRRKRTHTRKRQGLNYLVPSNHEKGLGDGKDATYVTPATVAGAGTGAPVGTNTATTLPSKIYERAELDGQPKPVHELPTVEEGDAPRYSELDSPEAQAAGWSSNSKSDKS